MLTPPLSSTRRPRRKTIVRSITCSKRFFSAFWENFTAASVSLLKKIVTAVGGSDESSMKRRQTNDFVMAVMSKPVVTVGPLTLVREALKIMVKHDIGTLVVRDQEKNVGILTERDITRHLSKSETGLDASAGDVMSSPIISATSGTPIWKAFELMDKYRIRRLPIVDEDKLVGIVTDRDLIRWVMKVLYSQVPTMPQEIKNILDQHRSA